MKKIMFTSVIVAVLLAVCIVPGVSQEFEFPSKGQLNFIKSEKKWLVPMAKDKKAFVEAVKEGNIAKVKKIMSDFPAFNFLTMEISTGEGEYRTVWPICIAAANGRTELIKYMVALDHSLSNCNCNADWGNPLDVAIDNQHGDTAVALIDLGYDRLFAFTPVLVKVAYRINDKAVLERLISVVLDKVDEEYNKTNPLRVNGHRTDALYKAAELKNVNFIIVLKDELKKRGINKPVAKYIGIVDAYNRDSFERLEESAKKSEAGLLLKNYGIDIYVGA